MAAASRISGSVPCDYRQTWGYARVTEPLTTLSGSRLVGNLTGSVTIGNPEVIRRAIGDKTAAWINKRMCHKGDLTEERCWQKTKHQPEAVIGGHMGIRLGVSAKVSPQRQPLFLRIIAKIRNLCRWVDDPTVTSAPDYGRSTRAIQSCRSGNHNLALRDCCSFSGRPSRARKQLCPVLRQYAHHPSVPAPR
jgi:hypothetical protein